MKKIKKKKYNKKNKKKKKKVDLISPENFPPESFWDKLFKPFRCGNFNINEYE